MRKRLGGDVMMAALILVAAGCGDDGATDDSAADRATPSTTLSLPLDVEVTEDVPYTSGKNVTVFSPSDGSEWPVVVYFHGGVPSPEYPDEESRALFTDIAEQGIVVYAPLWASEGPAGASQDSAGGSQDSVCVIAFAAETADDYGGDPERITLAGYSAGGYDAVIHGLVGDDPPLPVTDCAVDAAADPPQAAVSGGGPFFVADAARAGLIPSPAWSSLTPEQIDAFDPYLALGQNPEMQVRLWVGENDQGGNPDRPFPIVDSNREYYAALQEAEYDAELIEVPGGHEVVEAHRDSFVDTIVEAARGE